MAKKEKKIVRGLEGSVFDSELKIVPPVVIVPQRINSIIRYVQREVGNNEFSLLLKGRWTEDGYTILKQYYIPLQEVSSTSVDYKEDLSLLSSEWNTIYHSHPFSWGQERA